MPRILVTEPLADAGLDAMRTAGHEVDVQVDLSPEQLLEAVAGAHALIIRSATRVTAEVIEAGRDLVVVGRAGVGVDNVDTQAATRRGVMVVNAPGSNSLSTAEHALALLLAQARNIPQAHAALKGGKWERSRWEGVELHGKTMGVLGLGRIGTLVAQRAHAFGMRLVAWDPWMAPARARQLGIEMLELDELMATADFVSIHLNKSKDTVGLIGEDLLAKAKRGIRIVNAARGGIVDETALAQAIKNGIVAGAALDVFDTEPTTESPLFGLDSVVVTPHLAASTREAQDKAGQVIAEQVLLALSGDFVPFAINVEASEANEAVRAYLPLAERLGRLYALLNEGVPRVLEIEYQGEIGSYDTRILTLSLLKGLLSAATDEPVSYVNAPSLAGERGMEVRETKTTATHEYLNLVSVRGGDHGIGATLFGLRGEPRIVMIDDHDLELPLAPNLLVVRNDDRVGMMAIVTTAVAGAGVNIADMRLGRSPAGGTALAAITSDDPFPLELREKLSDQPGILDVRLVNQA